MTVCHGSYSRGSRGANRQRLGKAFAMDWLFDRVNREHIL